ncbi:hypothetical protein [uncultured Oscillibacter sp.]|uniref:hypothetical protein n=1 Tax=uncultured Oscillibacter sp. TaxID=876091 RepID=UPI0025D28C51|nr:hypothetical protein [uncultured Oscillibacter sp.]
MERIDKEMESEDQARTIEAAIVSPVERRTELEGYLERITWGEETQVSLTDPDSRLMKTKDGMPVCLNVQTAVDGKNKMVVESAVCNQVQDKNLMSPMAEKASEILDADHMTIVADNGYDNVSDVAQVLAGNNIPVVCGGDYEFWYPATAEKAGVITGYDETIARSVYIPSACSHCPKKCTTMRYFYEERMIMNKGSSFQSQSGSPGFFEEIFRKMR